MLIKEILSPFVFLALFLGIGGGALYLTPRIAKWIDEKRGASPSPYGEEPEVPADETDGTADPEEPEKTEEEQK